MNKRLFAMACALLLLCSGANAAFYTANPDRFYHASPDCVAGSTYEISETAARQFEKLACPVCVERSAVTGDFVEIEAPEGDFLLNDVDFRGGRLLLCGCIRDQKHIPWMAVYDAQGNKLQEYTGEPTHDTIRSAKFLSDGKIAIVRSIGGRDGLWHVQLMEGDQIVHQSEGIRCLDRIWATEDGGFFVYGGTKSNAYQLARCNGDGKILWTMDMDMFPQSDGQPGLKDLLVGRDIHIAFGSNAPTETYARPVILAFDDNGRVIGEYQVEKIIGEQTKTLYDQNMQPVGWETEDSYLGSFSCAAWADGGVVFAGAGAMPGFAAKYTSDGEQWYRHFSYLNDEYGCFVLDGKSVESGWIKDMIPCGDGFLLAMDTDIYTPQLGSGSEPFGRGYVRMALMNARGEITCDWFEQTGNIESGTKIKLFDDGGLYLFTYGYEIIPMKAYEEGYPITKLPRKAVLKQIDLS